MERAKCLGEGWEVSITDRGFLFRAPSKKDAYALLDAECSSLAKTASNWSYEATWISYPTAKRPIKIPATIATQEFIRMPQSIQFAQAQIPYELMRYVGEMAESDTRQGLIRIADNRQILMTNHCQVFAENLAAAVTHNRAQYWHLGDLAQFEVDWRRSLNDDGSNWFEFTYRTFEADHPEIRESWRKMVSRYRLVTDNQGVAYHVGECLDVMECEPVGL